MAPDWANGKKSAYNYHSLAELIGHQPGFAVFRRFATLNAKNLLYLQAELAELEIQLARLEVKDQDSDDVTHRNFQWQARLLMKSPPGADEQCKKVLQIREKLDEYNRLLFQQQRLYDIPSPNRHDLGQLREWLEREEYGGFFLEMPEDAWDERHDRDLVALSTRVNEGDRFSKWLADSVMPFIHRTILHRNKAENEPENKTYEYSDKTLNRVSELAAIVASSSLPTVSIFALYFISSDVMRLVFTLAFSIVFTCSLAIFTSARRSEIFAATVALAAVQVVFIGVNGGNH